MERMTGSGYHFVLSAIIGEQDEKLSACTWWGCERRPKDLKKEHFFTPLLTIHKVEQYVGKMTHLSCLIRYISVEGDAPELKCPSYENMRQRLTEYLSEAGFVCDHIRFVFSHKKDNRSFFRSITLKHNQQKQLRVGCNFNFIIDNAGCIRGVYLVVNKM